MTLIVLEPSLLGGGFVLAGAGAGGIFGSLMGLGFGAALAVLGRGAGSVEEISGFRSMSIGAVGGVLTAVVTSFLVAVDPSGLPFLAGLFGTIGAGLGGGLVAVAKSTDADQLSAGEDPLLLDTSEEGST